MEEKGRVRRIGERENGEEGHEKRREGKEKWK